MKFVSYPHPRCVMGILVPSNCLLNNLLPKIKVKSKETRNYQEFNTKGMHIFFFLFNDK